jgi:hypothetical protein
LLDEQVAEQVRELVRRAADVGGDSPVADQLAAAKQAQHGLGVANVYCQKHFVHRSEVGR